MTENPVYPEPFNIARPLLTALFGEWDGTYPNKGLIKLIRLPEYIEILERFREARDNGETLKLEGFHTSPGNLKKVKLSLDFKPESFEFGFLERSDLNLDRLRWDYPNSRTAIPWKARGTGALWDIVATATDSNGYKYKISLSDLLPLGHAQRIDTYLARPLFYYEIIETNIKEG